MNTQPSVRVGLIGCGMIAGRHLQWFLAKPECDVIALCDLSAEDAERKRDEAQGIRGDCAPTLTTDYRDVLSTPDIDAVAILLPHSLHYPVALEALRAGKHVLVEKPMVTDVAHGRELVREAAERNLRLAVGYQRSYLSEYVRVRQMVESGELGEVRFVSAHLEQSWFAHFLSDAGTTSWRKKPDEVGGGQLVDTGSHTVAALLDVTSLVPREAFAYVENSGLPVDVNTAAVIRFQGGAVGTLMVGGFGHSVTEVLRVVGDRASARIFFRTVREQSLEVNGERVDAKSLVPASTPNANFIDAILNGTAIDADGELGLRVAQLSEAIYRSAREGRPVGM